MSKNGKNGASTILKLCELLMQAEHVKENNPYCVENRQKNICGCEEGELCLSALSSALNISLEACRQLVERYQSFSFLGLKLCVRSRSRGRYPSKFVSLKVENLTIWKMVLGKRVEELESKNRKLREEMAFLMAQLESYKRSLTSLRTQFRLLKDRLSSQGNQSSEVDRNAKRFKFKSVLFDRLKESLNGDSAYIGVFERCPSLLGLFVFRHCDSLLDLAEGFGVGLDDVLLALGALRKAGVVKDVRFV
jgi:hypothetical protein